MESNAEEVSKCIRCSRKYQMNYGSNHSGRIWIGWNPNKFSVVKLTESRQMMVPNVNLKDLNFSFILAVIYTSNEALERQTLWDEMRIAAAPSCMPLPVIGATTM